MFSFEILALAIGFLLIATLYASVGFGGGSSYTAALATVGVATTLVPILSLSCNLIVSAGGVWYFTRRRHLRSRLIWPFLITSIPAAYLGGRLAVDTAAFLLLLGISLLAAAACLVVKPQNRETLRELSLPMALVVGAALGAISGMVGIGGGIFLAPALLLLGWGRPKEVAASAAVFILVNSLAGLAGQLTKTPPEAVMTTLVPLALAVLVGGQVGSRLGSGPLPSLMIRRATAVLVFVVGVRLTAQAIPLLS
jgi:uncharacterized protein